MTTITLTSKGQITLPVAARRALGLKASEKLDVRVNIEARTVTLQKPMRPEDLALKYGKLIPKGIKPVTDVDAYYQKYRKPRI